MFAVIYDKKTKKVHSIIVPEEGEYFDAVVKSLRFFDSQELKMIDGEVEGYPYLYKVQDYIDKNG